MMKPVLKTLLGGAVALGLLAPAAGAHDRALMLRHAMPEVMMMTHPAFMRTYDNRIFRGPVADYPVRYLKLKFDCVVAGTPVEFPNDIRISNPYNFTVAAGTLAKYEAPFGNTGTVVLPELKPGAGVFVSNVIPGGVAAGYPCKASQI